MQCVIIAMAFSTERCIPNGMQDHFVNFKTMDLVNAVNLVEGYDPIRIASPSMFLGELDHE